MLIYVTLPFHETKFIQLGQSVYRLKAPKTLPASELSISRDQISKLLPLNGLKWFMGIRVDFFLSAISLIALQNFVVAESLHNKMD